MKNDDEDLGMDRDISAPKDKMKTKIPRTLNTNNNISNSKNNSANSPSNQVDEMEEVEIVEEEEEEEDDEENGKENNSNNNNNNNKNGSNKITNENNKNLNSSRTNEIKEEKKNEEVDININLKNNENKGMKSSSCQVNLFGDDENEKIIQELKLKINKLEREKEELITQLNENQKKYEEKYTKQNKDINSLSILNNKLKKNLEKVNAQVTKLLNQVVANNSIPVSSNNSKMPTKTDKEKSLNAIKNKGKIIEEKEPNEEIKSLKEKLKFKEAQIKDSFQTIELLKKQNKKLRDDYNSLSSDGKSANQNHKLLEEIKKKNIEIRELEREYKNVISYKTGDEQLEYYKKKISDLTTLNDENKAKIIQLKQIVEKHQKKELENKKNANSNTSNSPITKEIQEKIEKLKVKKEGKSEYILNEFNNKKYKLNKNFNLLFNDLEKKTLFTLFPEEDDFQRFNQKLDIIENNFNSSARRFQTNINELKETIDDKEELIAYLREKIRENEMKIKILLNQIHLERNKNEKRGQQQNLSEKSNVNTRNKNSKKQ